MHDDETIKRLYFAFASKHKRTIKMVARRYHPHGDYLFESMLCDLTTHLWEIYPQLPHNLPDQDERVWVYTALNNKARSMVRDEQLRLSRIEYRDTLPDVAEEDEETMLTLRLYKLIDALDADDQKIINMYLEGKTMKEIGQVLGGSDQRAIRRIRKIREKLCELNIKLD